MVSAITDLTVALEEIERLKILLAKASIDDLTGLPRRGQFENRVAEQLSHHHHHPEYHFSIFVVDLDGLKPVNDVKGHHTGDKLLTEFAQLFKKLMREYDIVARFGGDEFVALLPGETVEGAERVRERLLKEFEEAKNTIAHFSGASIGVASTSQNFKDFEALYKEGDKDMYIQKGDKRRGLLKKTA